MTSKEISFYSNIIVLFRLDYFQIIWYDTTRSYYNKLGSRTMRCKTINSYQNKNTRAQCSTTDTPPLSRSGSQTQIKQTFRSRLPGNRHCSHGFKRRLRVNAGCVHRQGKGFKNELHGFKTQNANGHQPKRKFNFKSKFKSITYVIQFWQRIKMWQMMYKHFTLYSNYHR